MALIQINVPDDVKVRADAAFARNGITTPGAMKMMVTQVASENRTPFDGLFSVGISRELAQGVRRDMLRVGHGSMACCRTMPLMPASFPIRCLMSWV
ncbi:type II toxin-antitoxin system RelB/DinJ family antitoxin [Bifidobacterium pseudocatenulatum]|uniref:type II toxin-antitoxin system RelB/DinJ family antitoxin n=1 Tax=Bifidobacterium pseudocatenulatum TaxID=28026 RepID=UPI001CFC6028|nr:type II toxin-antitoxin system RelB/DinJ family antitoxin [Bifidobacterium pseudocatenulatum]